jgi:Icc-related predicted phosphoesterase
VGVPWGSISMILLVIADDNDLRQGLGSEKADILISCGDVADQVILQTAEAAGCEYIVAVKGNHDRPESFEAPILDLHLTTQTIDGVRFGGFQGSWKYKPRGHYLYEEQEVEKLLGSFPAADVFVAHNSPRHIHDREDNLHLGFEAFVTYIHRAKPRFFLHGHQHVSQETQVGGTRVIGVHGHKWLEI